ncbi:MAG: hypothetical protein Hens2KO_08460 [Henriciella sp.]
MGVPADRLGARFEWFLRRKPRSDVRDFPPTERGFLIRFSQVCVQGEREIEQDQNSGVCPYSGAMKLITNPLSSDAVTVISTPPV